MFAYRNSVRVAVLVSAIAVSTATASQLRAQGGPQAHRPAAAATALPSLEPARSILRHLVGRWRVEVRFAGNFDGAPDASGTRVVQTMFDDLGLQWTEDVDSSQVRSQGTIGFDARTGRFYSTAVYSGGSGAELLTGTLDRAEPLVTFSPAAPAAPAAPAPGAGSFTLRMVDPDHFLWAPADRTWRALLTREP